MTDRQMKPAAEIWDSFAEVDRPMAQDALSEVSHDTPTTHWVNDAAGGEGAFQLISINPPRVRVTGVSGGKPLDFEAGLSAG